MRRKSLVRTATRPRRRSRKSSPIISQKRGSTTSRLNGGARPATKPCAARPSRRRSPISARRSPWRTRRRGPAAGAAISKAEASRRVKLQNDYAPGQSYGRRDTRRTRPRPRSNARALSRRAPNFPLMGFLHFLVGFSGVGRAGNSARLRDIAERFLREAEAEGRIAEAQAAHLALGQACMQLGDLREARTQLELGLSRFWRSPAAKSEKSSALTSEQAPELSSRLRCGCQAISRAHVN